MIQNGLCTCFSPKLHVMATLARHSSGWCRQFINRNIAVNLNVYCPRLNRELDIDPLDRANTNFLYIFFLFVLKKLDDVNQLFVLRSFQFYDSAMK